MVILILVSVVVHVFISIGYIVFHFYWTSPHFQGPIASFADQSCARLTTAPLRVFINGDTKVIEEFTIIKYCACAVKSQCGLSV